MSTATLTVPTRPVRFGGLDGLRAIAVGFVLCFHFFPFLLPGGFLGVDVFFAISGFLITSLLIREFQLKGRIDLAGFWRRRARRLLPALALVLLVCTALALVVGGDLLVGIGAQFIGAALFVSNWVFIGTGTDYFTRDNPELFRNMWSLAVEEQFYLLLPLLFLFLMLRVRNQRTRFLILAVLGVTSATLMVVYSDLDVAATRIYFGSDSHGFGLLLGAALAMLTSRDPLQPPVSQPGRTSRFFRQVGLLLIAVAGLATLVWLSLNLREGSAESFQGGFQLATIAALLVVWAVTRPGALIGIALDVWPLRWIGERSYGLYLWHWPILVLLTAAIGDFSDWRVPVFSLIVTVVLAALSYRYVEQPVRRLGLRGSLAQLFKLGRRPDGVVRRRVVATTLACIMLTTVPASAYAIATAPQQSSSALAIERGQEMLAQQQQAAEAAAKHQTGSPEPGSPGGPPPAHGDDSTQQQAESKGGKAPKDGKDPRDGKPTTDQPVPPPVAPEGRDVSAIGDSVMLASAPELDAAFPTISIDAAVSRGLGAGVSIVLDQESQGALRRVVVIGLGTNGPIAVEDLDALKDLAGDRPLVLVNAHGERDWIPGVNQTLAEFAAAHRGVVVADWTGAVTGVPDALAGDGIHPNPSGGDIYAASVAQAFKALLQPDEALGFGVPRR